MAADPGGEALTVASVVQAHRVRQLARLAKLPDAERPSAFLVHLDRYSRELVADLTPLVGPDAAARQARQATLATLTVLLEAA